MKNQEALQFVWEFTTHLSALYRLWSLINLQLVENHSVSLLVYVLLKQKL